MELNTEHLQWSIYSSVRTSAQCMETFNLSLFSYKYTFIFRIETLFIFERSRLECLCVTKEHSRAFTWESKHLPLDQKGMLAHGARGRRSSKPTLGLKSVVEVNFLFFSGSFSLTVTPLLGLILTAGPLPQAVTCPCPHLASLSINIERSVCE